MNTISALAAGVGLVLLYFGALWLSVRRLARGKMRPWIHVSGGLARFAALGLALAGLARAGAGALLAGAAGVWLARTILVCRLGGFRHGS